MATTLKSDQLVIARFIRRAELPRISITTWRDGMADNLIALKSADWKEAAYTTEQTQHPTNDPTLEDYSAENYDAFKQAASAKNNTMTQFAGMAAYRIALPAAGGNVQTVKLRAGTDKFCVGGLKIAAILSNSEAPPTGWDILRAGGTDEAIDSTGVCATLGETDAESGNEIKGILDGTTDTGKTSVAMVGDVTFTLPEQSTNYQYLYLVITLFDYTSYRLPLREYWVEGSGILSAESLEITFANDFTPPTANIDYDVVHPMALSEHFISDTSSPDLAIVGKLVGLGDYINQSDVYLARQSVVQRLAAGSDIYEYDNNWPPADKITFKGLHRLCTYMRSVRGETSSSGDALAPAEIQLVSYSGNYPALSTKLEGYTLWLKSIGETVGASKIRVSLFNYDVYMFKDEVPDPTYPDVPVRTLLGVPGLWGGTHPDILGTATFSAIKDGQVVGIPITKNPTKPFLFIFCCMANIAASDTSLTRIGYKQNTDGLSVANCHISKIYYPGE